MNENFAKFQKINQSVDKLLANQYNSVDSEEIKDSANRLKQSIEPCINELKASATKLEKLIEVCHKDLDHAKDIWKSKEKIVNSSQREIWTQVGDLTGIKFQLTRLEDKYKKLALEEAEKYTATWFNDIKNKHFIDPKTNKIRSKIGLWDKDNFNNYINNRLDNYIAQVDYINSKYLEKIYLEVAKINIEQLKNHFSLFDRQYVSYLHQEFDDRIEKINYLHKKPFELFTFNFKKLPNLHTIFKEDIEKWKNRIVGEITLEEVSDFKKWLNISSSERMTILFDDRINFVKNFLEQVILFYNNLLEKQNNYKEESNYQKIAEKEWIEKQKKELKVIQNNCKKIIDG